MRSEVPYYGDVCLLSRIGVQVENNLYAITPVNQLEIIYRYEGHYV